MVTFDLTKQNVWVTSDTHYGHKNICRGVSEWVKGELNPSHSGTRDFKTLSDMNEALVCGINDNVFRDDVLIHLGDWSFGGLDNVFLFRNRLACKNIYLVYGNHDHHIKGNKRLENCYRSPEGNIVKGSIKENYYADYKYGELTTNEVFAQDLFTYVDHVLDFKVKLTNLSKIHAGSEYEDGVEFFASHYSHRVWDKHHKGRFHIYGHSHTSLEYEEYGRSMDVGVDNAYRLFGEYRPFHIREVFSMLKGREILRIDHHDKSTN